MEIVGEARYEQDLAFARVKARRGIDCSLLALAVIVVVAVGGSFLTAKVTGSLGIPHNDDWSYGKTALLFASKGQLHLQGWGEMFLLGQVFTALPFLFLFGQHESALQLYGAAAAILVLACTYLLARPCVTRWRSVAIVGAVALVPGFTLLAPTYMTDLPGIGAALLTMVLAASAIRWRSLLWFSAALLAGLWAFTIRETMLAALVAACVSVLIAPTLTRRFRALAAVLTGLVLVVCFVLEGLRDSLPAAQAPTFSISGLHLPVSAMLTVYLTLGLFVLPLTAWATVRQHRWGLTQPARILGWALGALPAVHLVLRHSRLSTHSHRHVPINLTLGNYLDLRGAYWQAIPGQPGVIFSPAIWHLVQLLAVLGGVLLAGELMASTGRPGQWIKRIRRWDPALQQSAVFTALSAAILAYLCMSNQLMFDRYLLTIVPCVGIVLLSRVPPLQARNSFLTVVGVSAIVAVLGFTSADLMWSADARDAAVWAAAQKLVEKGASPREINAGLAWDGFYASGPADMSRHYPDTYSGESTIGDFVGSSDCWIVSMSKVRNPPKLVTRKSYVRPYGTDFGKAPLYVMHRPGCGSPRA